jgi:hypothetical protein
VTSAGLQRKQFCITYYTDILNNLEKEACQWQGDFNSKGVSNNGAHRTKFPVSTTKGGFFDYLPTPGHIGRYSLGMKETCAPTLWNDMTSLPLKLAF